MKKLLKKEMNINDLIVDVRNGEIHFSMHPKSNILISSAFLPYHKQSDNRVVAPISIRYNSTILEKIQYLLKFDAKYITELFVYNEEVANYINKDLSVVNNYIYIDHPDFELNKVVYDKIRKKYIITFHFNEMSLLFRTIFKLSLVFFKKLFRVNEKIN